MTTTIIVFCVIVLFILYLFKGKMFFKPKEKHIAYTIDDQYNAEKKEIQDEIDSLLSKMGKNGLEDLSEKQKLRLQELSKKLK
ncbi:MAG: rhomboid family protein [Bacteroidetes bacterium]|jgi:hypothetical protein|nr:rhomboid family protein [Bacteroidota bacterium]